MEKNDIIKTFFMEAENLDDDFAFLTPVRDKEIVEPLIDGRNTFEEIENCIFAARKHIYLALWIFNPFTPIQSVGVKASDIKLWKDLLGHAASNGVKIRLILTDFDPIFQNSNHKSAWNAFNTITNFLSGTKDFDFQLICSRHEATIKFLKKTPLRKELQKELTKIKDQLNKQLMKNSDLAIKTFHNSPGLWQSIVCTPKKAKFEISHNPDYTIYPAAHHQKICIIDDEVAFCGGLDINTGRIDSPEHNSSKTAWHDVHVKLKGASVFDIKRNFISRWNNEESKFKQFIEHVNSIEHTNSSIPRLKIVARKTEKLVYTGESKSSDGVALVPRNFRSERRKHLHGESKSSDDVALVQVHRTLSVDNPRSMVPRNVRKDIEGIYSKAISNANSYIYIENQYIRSDKIADWITNRFKEKPNLEVIIVLPVAPEEVAQAAKVDLLTNHGLYLQHKVLSELKEQLGDNIGFFSMVKREKAPFDYRKHKTNSNGSLQIYVHSKVLIIDDIFAIIGSANANDRGFRVDTELNIGWYEPSKVVQFRQQLWNELLGFPPNLPKWKDSDYLREWNRIALSNNKTVEPHKRKGFIVPHDIASFPGKRSFLAPDAFAEYFDFAEKEDLTYVVT